MCRVVKTAVPISVPAPAAAAAAAASAPAAAAPAGINTYIIGPDNYDIFFNGAQDKKKAKEYVNYWASVAKNSNPKFYDREADGKYGVPGTVAQLPKGKGDIKYHPQQQPLPTDSILNAYKSMRGKQAQAQSVQFYSLFKHLGDSGQALTAISCYLQNKQIWSFTHDRWLLYFLTHAYIAKKIQDGAQDVRVGGGKESAGQGSGRSLLSRAKPSRLFRKVTIMSRSSGSSSRKGSSSSSDKTPTMRDFESQATQLDWEYMSTPIPLRAIYVKSLGSGLPIAVDGALILVPPPVTRSSFIDTEDIMDTSSGEGGGEDALKKALDAAAAEREPWMKLLSSPEEANKWQAASEEKGIHEFANLIRAYYKTQAKKNPDDSLKKDATNNLENANKTAMKYRTWGKELRWRLFKKYELSNPKTQLEFEPKCRQTCWRPQRVARAPSRHRRRQAWPIH